MLVLGLDVLLAELEEVVGSERGLVLGRFGGDARGGRRDVGGRAAGGGGRGEGEREGAERGFVSRLFSHSHGGGAHARIERETE